jgi:hypothetical protein
MAAIAGTLEQRPIYGIRLRGDHKILCERVARLGVIQGAVKREIETGAQLDTHSLSISYITNQRIGARSGSASGGKNSSSSNTQYIVFLIFAPSDANQHNPAENLTAPALSF